jgi:hypothetical protein
MHHGVSDQSRASQHRRVDSDVLLQGGRWRGAMYLAGYRLECLLKFKLMRKFDCGNIGELDEELKRRGLIRADATMYTHDFESLLRASEGFDRLRRAPEVWYFFLIVNRWVPAWRYNPDQANEGEATSFLEAIDQVANWIDANV